MPQFKSIICLIILLFFCADLFGQTEQARNLLIRRSVGQKNLPLAISELENLQNQNSSGFYSNNYDYLLARLLEKQGNISGAINNYQSVVNRDSVLKQYALWHLSQIMRFSGNLIMEKLYLQELSINQNKSLLNDVVRKRLIRNSLDSENYSRVISRLTKPPLSTKMREDNSDSADNSHTLNHSRKALVLLAKAYLLNKQPKKAREIFTDLVDDVPNKNRPDDYALAGVIALDRLKVGDKEFEKTAPKLPDEQHFTRAKIYQFNRNFERARLHYKAIISNHKESKNVPISLFRIGRGCAQERKFKEAIKWFERLQNEYPDDNLAALALYQSAGNYANLDNTKEAVSRYEKYIDENPKARNLERAYLNIVDAYRDAGEPAKALQWTAKTREKFKDKIGEAVALFSQARIHLAQSDWQTALKDLTTLRDMKNLGGIKIAGGTNKAEVGFLVGFVLEKLNRPNEAIEAYLSIPDGRKEYYGMRASAKLRALLKDENIYKKSNRVGLRFNPIPNNELIPSGKIVKFGRENILTKPVKTQQITHKTISDELLFLGLYDEGTPELETALRENLSNQTGSLSDFSSDAAFTLAVFYKRGNMAHRAIAYIEHLWKKVPRDFPVKHIPREHLELLYPKPYQTSLVKYGKERNVDPRFILSIMRQESRFQANVKSVAAARGLMQFISTTSNKMAQEMKLEAFDQDDLYHPPTAIRFGAHYLSNIFKDFPDQPAAVAASYNGGEDRMMRWLKRAKNNSPDQYVPEIIFTQTKNYAYKVMANYRIYKMLYDQNLSPIEIRKPAQVLDSR